MPKVKIDYSNTIFYKIYCKDLSIKELYIGHTTNFVQRKHSHKQGCINPKSANYKCKLYKIIRDNMGWDNWTMEIIAFHNCEDLYSAKKQEQHYFEEYKATLNSIEPLPPRKPKKEVVIKTPKEVLYCDSCRVYFSTRKLQEEHNKRPRHLKLNILPMNTPHNIQVTTILNKPTQTFHCEKCNYTTPRKSQYDRHILTVKHIRIHENTENSSQKFKIHKCELCNNEYKFHSGLWKHKKTCMYDEHNAVTENILTKEPVNDDNTDMDVKVLSNTIFELVKQNNEFKQLLLEQNRKMMEMGIILAI
jgi:hypothetical protein